jgi:hypothetical protein
VAQDLKNKPSYFCAAYHARKDGWRIAESSQKKSRAINPASVFVASDLLPAQRAIRATVFFFIRQRGGYTLLL